MVDATIVKVHGQGAKGELRPIKDATHQAAH